MKHKLVSIAFLLLLNYLLLDTPAFSQETGDLTSVTFRTNHHRIFAEIFSGDMNVSTPSNFTVPAEIDLPPGDYIVRFSLAGYRTEEIAIEVSGEQTQIWVQLEPDLRWQELYSSDTDVPYQIVEFREEQGGFIALIDITSTIAIEAYLNDQVPIDDNIEHYVYSHGADTLYQVTSHELPVLADHAVGLDVSDWAKSNLAYHLVSPSGKYAIIPQPNGIDPRGVSNMWLANLDTRESHSLGIELPDPALVWRLGFLWAQDNTRVIVPDRAGKETSLVIIGDELQQTQVVPLLNVLNRENPNVLRVELVNATSDLEKMLLFVTAVGPAYDLVVFDTASQNVQILPVSDQLFGAQWANSNRLVILTVDGLLLIDFPSLEIHQLLAPDEIPLQTLEHVYFPPDFSYMIAYRSAYYDAAILAYDFGEMLSSQIPSSQKTD